MHINVAEILEQEWFGSVLDQADHAHCMDPSEKEGSEAVPKLKVISGTAGPWEIWMVHYWPPPLLGVSLLFWNFKAHSDRSLPVSGPLLALESMSVIHKSCNSVFITWAVTGEALQKLLTAGTGFSHNTVQMILLILLRGARATGRLLTLPVNQD